MDLVSLFGVSGRVALVTGGSRGIGLMIAEGLVSNGAKVYITSRDEKVCKKSEQKLNLLAKQGGSAVAFTSDLSTEKGCIEAVEFIKARESKLHILINNSGTNWGEALDKYPIDAFDKLFRLNLFGYFSLVQKLLPLLEAGASSEWSANVINIGSVMGISVPKLEVYAYATSKAAVHHLTKILAPKLAEKNITCNAFAPVSFLGLSIC
jgi:NAD(P)-dependent dehydrogenase (short-subunit alcohol dehydrogenase family)